MPEGIEFDDDERYAAGFVLNKLYTLRLYARRGNVKHGKHTELANMPKGLPPDARGAIIPVCRRMNGKLVLIFKSTSDDHICALLEDEAIALGRELCNSYRKKHGLPPIDRFFKEVTEDIPQEDVPKEQRKLSDKEKRNREYLRKVEEWRRGQGLP